MWEVALSSLPIGLLIGYLFGRRRQRAATSRADGLARHQVSTFDRISALDRNLFLKTLRRELANILMERDPKGFLTVYQKAFDHTQSVSNLSADYQRTELAKITDRFVNYEDFDIIEKKDFVSYPEATIDKTFEELAEHFLTIIRFESLMSATDEEWRHFTIIVEKDLMWASIEADRVDNKKLQAQIESAMKIYEYAGSLENKYSTKIRFDQNGKRIDGNILLYENREFSVYDVHSYTDTVFGFHFKDADEYAIQSTMTSHGGQMSFYRSNRDFTKMNSLIIQ